MGDGGAKRRWLPWTIGVVVVALLAGSVVVVATRHSTSKPRKLVALSHVGALTAVVVLPWHPDPALVHRTETSLDAMPSVRRYALGSASTPQAENLALLCHGNEVLLVEGATQVDMRGLLEHALAHDVRVIDTTQDKSHDLLRPTVEDFDPHADIDMEIFLKNPVADADVTALRAKLADDPAVSHIQFLDHQAALEQFEKLFKDQPGLLQSTKADDLPMSFRVRIAQHASLDAEQAAYEQVPGVDSVITAAPNIKC